MLADMRVECIAGLSSQLTAPRLSLLYHCVTWTAVADQCAANGLRRVHAMGDLTAIWHCPAAWRRAPCVTAPFAAQGTGNGLLIDSNTRRGIGAASGRLHWIKQLMRYRENACFTS